MKYEVSLETRANKQLERLADPELKRVFAALDALALAPRPAGVKKLKGKHSGLYRVRVGDIRILYRVDDSARQVQVWEMGKRPSVYRKK